jgi:predicted metal-dependent hydrolase
MIILIVEICLNRIIGYLKIMVEKFFENKKTGERFYYRVVKRKRMKNLNLVIGKDQSVRVAIPASRLRVVTQGQIENILKERFDFVMEAISKYKRQGKKYPDLFDFSKEHYQQHRKSAQEFIKAKVDYYCRENNFEYNRISIRNQKTRWGSCSSSGNLNFSYKLIFLTPEEMDYIVVHELCHLKEQNHSRDFWALVESILPEYKNAHKSIRNKS